jgi:tRNA threonylcarbamoyladenosine biosynthesis protein TsaB
MKILALEFSSSWRSVAVLNGQSFAVGEVVSTASGEAIQPLAMVESALRQAGVEREQIEAIAIGLGPGSYNGIRAAIALAQGWQLARGVKLIGVSSAEGIVAQAGAEGVTGICYVVIDAQRGEFYVAGYEVNDQAAHEVSALHLTGFDEVRRLEQAGEILVGPDVTRWVSGGRPIFPRAATLGRIALGRQHFVTGDKLKPIYLRETAFVKAPPARSV